MCACFQETGCHLCEFWGWARAVATIVGSRGGQGLLQKLRDLAAEASRCPAVGGSMHEQ